MEPESRKTDTLSPLFRFSVRLEFSVVGYGNSAVKLPFSSAWMYAQTPALLPSTPLNFGSSLAEIRPLFSLTASTEPFEPSWVLKPSPRNFRVSPVVQSFTA